MLVNTCEKLQLLSREILVNYVGPLNENKK